MKKLLIMGFIVIAFFLAFYYFNHPLTSKIKINGTTFTVEVAITEPQKELGLGNRASLSSDHGMLFPYDHKEQYEYWMKGMQFPLDFIWIDGKTVVDVTPNVPSPMGSDQPVIVKPGAPVDKVFEVNAGSIQRADIHIGDSVEFIDR